MSPTEELGTLPFTNPRLFVALIPSPLPWKHCWGFNIGNNILIGHPRMLPINLSSSWQPEVFIENPMFLMITQTCYLKPQALIDNPIYLHSTQMKPCNHRVVATTSQLIEKPGRQVTLTTTKNTSSYFQTQLWLNVDEIRWSLSYSCPTLPCGFSTPSRQVALTPIQWWYSIWCIFYRISLGVAIKPSSMLPTWEMRVLWVFMRQTFISGAFR